jgi:mannose-6-phosphate isomerase-like protein (cupin superfamily)
MKIIKRNDLGKEFLPGRAIQKAVGRDSYSSSNKMTMGFANYSKENGLMEPHHHAEEIVFIVGSKDGWVRYGGDSVNLGEPIMLSTGMILHIPALEWHMFEFSEGGYVDIIFFYGQVDKIRPEEMN